MIPHNRNLIGAEEEGAALRVLRSGWLGQGKEVSSFENEICHFLGLPEGHAVAASSGSAALFLSLWALKAKGRDVALPTYVCASLRQAVDLAGGKSRILDVAEGTPNIDLQLLKKSGAGIAIVPHMFGIPCDIRGLSGVDVIEDCAHALGAAIAGVPAGLSGRLGVLSFFSTKLMSSGGQGGMVVSKEKALIDSIRDYLDYDGPRDDRSRFNFQMTDLEAAVGQEQLRKLPAFLERRQKIFARYKALGLDFLDAPAGASLRCVRYRAILRTPQPEKTIEKLEKRGVKALVPIARGRLLDASCPNALKLADETVSIPLYPDLSDAEVNAVVSALESL